MVTPADYGLDHETFRPHQLETLQMLEAIDDDQTVIVQAPTGCHAFGQGILMFDGSIKQVQNVKVGNKLMGPDSNSRTVRKVISGYGKMYCITPVKGNPFCVNDDHILTLQRTRIKSGNRSRSDCRDYDIVDVSVKEWLLWSNWKKHIYKLFRPSVVEFDRSKHKLPISPYFLGVLLGDGCIGNTISVTTSDNQILTEIKNQAEEWGLSVRSQKAGGKSISYYLQYKRGQISPLMVEIINLNLRRVTSGNKFVPFIYKTSSVENRLQLLAGLIDTDGSVSSNCIDYISKSIALSNDVAFVCRSIGLAAYVTECQKSSQNGTVGTYYRVSISGSVDRIPCRIKRKKASRRKQIKSVLRTGFSVKQIDSNMYYGFTLDHDGRYLMDDFTITHNSGKTSFAAGMAVSYPVLAVAKTKLLQMENYGQTYGFDYLFGRANYNCAQYGGTAALCKHVEKPTKCPSFDICEYYRQRETVMNSSMASVNYALFLVAGWIRGIAPQKYKFYDECHLLSDIVVETTSVRVDGDQRDEWLLDEFPDISSGGDSMYVAMFGLDPSKDAIEWMVKVQNKLKQYIGARKEQALIDDDIKKKVEKAQSMLYRASSTIGALNRNPADWYIKSGSSALNGKPGFICKPLTARHHFPRRFLPGGRSVLMSATVGNFETFSTELGIADYETVRVPSVWPPKSRPVYYSDKCPPIGSKTGDEELEDQADFIAEVIESAPPNWSGVIHVSSKWQARSLGNRLAMRGFDHRIWKVPELSTDRQLKRWHFAKKQRMGALAIAWSWWEGVDLLDEKITICAKVPFPRMGAPGSYERARMEFDGKFYLQRAAWQLQQGCGRTRRGRPEDYDTGDRVAGMVVVADGNWKRVRNYMDDDFLESMTPWENRHRELR